FRKLAEFGSTAKKDDLGNWPDHVPQELRGLILDLATYSKQQGWINQETNFPKMLSEIYTDLLPEQAPKPTKAAGEEKTYPLDQKKAKKASAGGEAAGEKKLSPLEQMKAKKKSAGGEGAAGEKKLSPLEQMKAKTAAKKKAPAEGG